jgi:large subunit ribosomal protein L27
MAHKKAGGSVKTGRDSRSKRLGVKVFGSQFIKSGEIIIRQRGTKFHPGVNVKRVSDDSLISLVDGVVEFNKKSVVAFSGNLRTRRFVSVKPIEVASN